MFLLQGEGERRGGDLAACSVCRLETQPGSGGCPRVESNVSQFPKGQCRMNTTSDNGIVEKRNGEKGGREKGPHHIALLCVLFASQHFRCGLRGMKEQVKEGM